ncbi:MAG: DUF4178 domain-containing protein [Halobacteriovoraceae bacterium]|mgnify:CR=1 FL=1|jgi:hypothetical protein|nr:DUF4178 domain-containing protein [Halobacteriovoraceae bacterium]MBT5095350.1 DUF4178 domain-containing protein [Halobacteriovoraceae bacterium]
MLKLACPSCGGEVNFRSKTSVFAVCTFCKSNLIRTDLDLETFGEMGELREDSSPIQLGTRGKFNGTWFDVVGRVKVSWSDGNWNEWYLYFEDGRAGWLADAAGEFAINFATDQHNAPALEAIATETSVELEKNTYTVSDIKEITCAGSEGELPFKALKGRKSTSVDLLDSDENFASIEYSEDEGILAFTGKYVELDSLNAQNLKQFEDW